MEIGPAVAAEHEVEIRVREIAGGAMERRGFDLVDVEYRRESTGWTLRVYIDKKNGVTLADCQGASHEIGTLLEVEALIPHRFNLEVSSPGLDRPLKRQGDFEAALGQRIKLSVKEPIDGRCNFIGRLAWVGEAPGVDREEGAIARIGLVDESGAKHALPLSNIDRARLIYEWPEPVRPGRGQRRGAGRKG